MKCALTFNFDVSKMNEKKVVSRNIAIGIGVICIVLVATLVVINKK